MGGTDFGGASECRGQPSTGGPILNRNWFRQFFKGYI